MNGGVMMNSLLLAQLGWAMPVDLGSGGRRIETAVKEGVANGFTAYECETMTTLDMERHVCPVAMLEI